MDPLASSGSNADPHRSFVAGRVAAAGLFARALIALMAELSALRGAMTPPSADNLRMGRATKDDYSWRNHERDERSRESGE